MSVLPLQRIYRYYYSSQSASLSRLRFLCRAGGLSPGRAADTPRSRGGYPPVARADLALVARWPSHYRAADIPLSRSGHSTGVNTTIFRHRNTSAIFKFQIQAKMYVKEILIWNNFLILFISYPKIPESLAPSGFLTHFCFFFWHFSRQAS